MTEEVLDEQLVERAQNGDKRAFELLVRREYTVQHWIVRKFATVAGGSR